MAWVRVEGLTAYDAGIFRREGGASGHGSIRPNGRCGLRDARPDLEGLSFTVERGEILALVGEERGGKDALLAALLGLSPPAKGSVSLGEVELTGLRGNSLRRLRRRFQAVFADDFGQLVPEFTVEEHFGEVLGLWHRNETTELRRSRVEEVMILCGLPEAVRDLFPAELDAAERQQVALACALLSGPDWLLCHEVTRGLDAFQAAELINLVKRIRDLRNPAVLVTTDDLAVACQVGDTVGVLHQGRLVEIGSAERLATQARHPCTRRLASLAS